MVYQILIKNLGYRKLFAQFASQNVTHNQILLKELIWANRRYTELIKAVLMMTKRSVFHIIPK